MTKASGQRSHAENFRDDQEDQQRDEGRQHEQVAVREVHHADDAEHHRIADGDEAVDRTERQPVDQLLQEIAHAPPLSPVSHQSRRDRARVGRSKKPTSRFLRSPDFIGPGFRQQIPGQSRRRQAVRIFAKSRRARRPLRRPAPNFANADNSQRRKQLHAAASLTISTLGPIPQSARQRRRRHNRATRLIGVASASRRTRMASGLGRAKRRRCTRDPRRRSRPANGEESSMPVTMTGEVTLPADRSTVWAMLNDPAVLKASIPGVNRSRRRATRLSPPW